MPNMNEEEPAHFRRHVGGRARPPMCSQLRGPTSPSEPLSAAAVDAIVTRVVDRVQLSITEVLTRELLRPIVEALVRSELDNH